MTAVRVSITAFIDEYQPGIVECCLADVHGHTWKFHEKVPVVSAEDLWIDSEYPQPGSIECKVLESKRSPSGQQILIIQTIESVEGVTVFEIFAEQLERSEDKTGP
jgi:hypothetical protein